MGSLNTLSLDLQQKEKHVAFYLTPLFPFSIVNIGFNGSFVLVKRLDLVDNMP